MQVMPETAKNPGYGITPARDNSPEELARVGREFLPAMLREFGDPKKAWAAYNAGPGRLQEAIKTAAKDGGTYLDYLPKETQDYVAKNMKAYDLGAGRDQIPTKLDIHNQIRERLGNAPASVVKLALDEGTRQFDDLIAAQKQKEEQNLANAMRLMDQNGGRVSKLPAEVQAANSGHMDKLITYGQKIAKGDDISNPALTLKLSNPKFLASLSSDQLYAMRFDLSTSDYDKFSAQLNGERTTADKLNMAVINDTLGTALQLSGINTNPSQLMNSEGVQKLAAITSVVHEVILNEQKQLGRQLTPEETIKKVNNVLSTNSEIRGVWGTVRESKQIIKATLSDVPSDIKDRIKTDLKARGNSNPTDGEIWKEWLRTNLAGGKNGR
jgi:soluble lytic murein transglycosylase